jgi:hypothetical protein
MKSITKYLIALSLGFATYASSLSTNLPAGGGLFQLQPGYQKINAFTLVNATATNALFYVIDAPSTLTTWTNGVYVTQAYSAPANTVTTYTNIFGNVENITNLSTTITITTNAAGPVNYSQVLAISVPASNSVSVTAPSGTYLFRGLLVTNNTALSVTVDYSK